MIRDPLFAANEQRLTPEECWAHLEQIDERVANERLDNRTWRKLQNMRVWWVQQLQHALERDAFHQTFHQSKERTRCQALR